MRLILMVVFYLKSFPHEVEFEIFLENLYHKMILPTAAIFGLKNVVEHGVLESAGGELFLVINVKADW